MKHLNHIYGQGTIFEQYALKDVNLTIHDGEFIGLIGHTGSGKSTLTQHLNGLLKATSGDILYNGESIYKEGYSMKELRSHVGLVFQYPEHQLFEVDVFSDVCFGPKNLGLPKEEIEKRRDPGDIELCLWVELDPDLLGVDVHLGHIRPVRHRL